MSIFGGRVGTAATRAALTAITAAALAIGSLGLGALQRVAQAAGTTITVNTLNDLSSCPGIPTSLRCAIAVANANVGPTTIVFSVDGTITLTSTLKLTNTTQPITIDGSGHAITVSGGGLYQVFALTDINTTLNALTIAYGSYAGNGGGISNTTGALTISNSTMTGNSALTSGGGVYNTSGALTISNSTVTSNSAKFDGGGVFNSGGTLTITNSTLSGNSTLNSVTGGGGAIFSGSGSGSALTISSSTLSGNSTPSNGGAIFAANFGVVMISNSTLSGNSAQQNGGAIDVQNGDYTAIANSTLSGNSAVNGGGIFIESSGVLDLLSTILAKNTLSGGSGPDVNKSGAGTLTSLGYNLIGDGTASGLTNGTNQDQVGTSGLPIDPLLGSLADNSGPTQTLAIPTSSPAYQTGYCGGNNTVTPPVPAVTTDQRGQPRKGTTTGCDVGAYEKVTALITTPTNTVTSTPTTTPTSTSTPNATNTPGGPQTIIVNSASDDHTAGTGACVQSGITCLRDAIATANSASVATTITFSVDGTIAIASTLTLTNATQPVVIDARWHAITIDASGKCQVINVTGLNTTLNALTIANGYSGSDGAGISNATGTLTISNSTVSGNSVYAGGGNGGGVFNASGTVTISNSTVSGNTAKFNGGGVDNYGGTVTLNNSTVSGNLAQGGGNSGGGGVFNFGNVPGATVTINNSMVSGNSTPGQGGGVLAIGFGVVTISSSTLSNNTASNGGGIAAESLNSTITNSLLSSNTATNGAGIYTDHSSAVTLNNSTVFSNQADYGSGVYNNGGATATITSSLLYNNPANHGGAVYNISGTVLMSNSTVTGSPVTYDGGGIGNGGGTMTIANSTISGSSALSGGGISVTGGTVNLLSTIVAKNTLSGTGGSGPDVNISGTGTIVSLGYNLIGDGTSGGITPGTGDQIGTSGSPIDPLLGALGDNGGPTQTLALQLGSPAYRKGYCGGNNTVTPPPPAVTVDQRGQPRKPTLIGCDTGAYETQALPTATPTNTNTATATATLTRTPTATTTATNTATSTPVPAKIDSIGIYRGGTFYLRLHNSIGYADLTVSFTAGTKPYPIVGDWTGTGVDTVGIFDRNNGLFTLCTANVTATCANVANQKSLVLGFPNDQPLSGRWLLSATTAGVGVFRPSNGLIYLKDALTTGYADHTMVLGIPGDVGLAGDWNGKGFDSPGVYRPSNSFFYLSNKVTNGSVYGDYQLQYGLGGDAPVVGDWIAQGHDGVGLFRQSNGFTYLKNLLTTGYADNTFTYGIAGDVPVAGHWQSIYPPIAPASVLIARTAIPIAPNGSIPGDNLLGD